MRLLLAASGQVANSSRIPPSQLKTQIKKKKTELSFQATSLDGNKYDLHSSVKKLTRYILCIVNLQNFTEYSSLCQNNRTIKGQCQHQAWERRKAEIKGMTWTISFPQDFKPRHFSLLLKFD